jgi:hypothetical protein
MIRDKRNTERWTQKVSDWEKYDGDIVIGRHSRFDAMVSVAEVDTDSEYDYITHRGVFWKDKDAEAFAELLDSGEISETKQGNKSDGGSFGGYQ